MARNCSRKHVSDVEAAQETLVPLSTGGIMNKRIGRKSGKITVQANIHDDEPSDDIGKKGDSHQKNEQGFISCSSWWWAFGTEPRTNRL